MIIYLSNGSPFLDVEVNDNSYRYREIMRTNEVYLEFSLAEHVEIPLGAYCLVGDEKYSLSTPENVTIKHTRQYDYAVTFVGTMGALSRFRIVNQVDGRLQFDLIDTASNHMKQLVDNLNARDRSSGWRVVSCIETSAKLISYNHTLLVDALNQIASTFDTEWEIIGKNIYLGKVEHDKDNPLPLSYGYNKGFESDIRRTNSDGLPVERLYVQGGDRNIFSAVYGSPTLHLPAGVSLGFDGEHFSDEPAYRSGSGNIVISTDGSGRCVSLSTAAEDAMEDSIDLSHIYPKRVGEVADVMFIYKGGYYTLNELLALDPVPTEKEWEDIQVDFTDELLPEDLDYSADGVMIPNEHLTVIFQSGALAGREFDVNFIKEGSASGRPANRFELIKTSMDGVDMPTLRYLPVRGDSYAVFHCSLPHQYLNATNGNGVHSGAEWDLLREACKYLIKHCKPNYVYNGKLDGLYAKRHWNAISPYMRLGSFVRFTDPKVQPTAFDVRITAIKDFINKPMKPEITLSNNVSTAGLTNTLKSIKAESVHNEMQRRESIQFTKRTFRNAQQTISMLEQAFGDYDNSIKPASVQTLMMLVGDEGMQFEFLNRRDGIVEQPLERFEADTNTFTFGSSVNDSIMLHHLTLGNKNISAQPEGRHFWFIPNKEQILEDPLKQYYLYAKCSKDMTEDDDGLLYGEGEFILSDTPMGMKGGNAVTDAEGNPVDDDYYYFLVGCLLDEDEDGERSYNSVYGFTEISGGRITTEVIKSSNGLNFFDLLTGSFVVCSADGSTYIKWNENGDGELRICGALNVTSEGTEYPTLNPRGEWKTDTDYAYGDLIEYNGSVYWRSVKSTAANHSPASFPDEWTIFIGAAKTITKTEYAYGRSRNYYTYPSTWYSNANEVEATATYPYFWTRTTVTYSDNTTDTGFQYVKMGTNGPKGDSNIYADCDHDSEGIGVGSDGRVNTQVTLSTTVSMWYGLTQLSLKSITFTNVPSGITASRTLSSGKVTFQIAEGATLAEKNEITITVTASYDGDDYSKDLVFSIAGIKSGESGVVYSLVTNVSSVKKDKDGNYSVDSVSCARKRRVGDGSLTDTSLGELKYSIDGGAERTYSGPVSTSSFTESLTFLFYMNSAVIATETILMLVDGTDGTDGDDGQGVFKSIVFRRSDTDISSQIPSGGSYLDPKPSGSLWSDGVPSGKGQLWMSTRIFTSDGKDPQQSNWTTPQIAMDSVDVDFEYSAETSVNNPSVDPAGTWHDAASATEGDIWMAVRYKNGDGWSDWKVFKIKGESAPVLYYEYAASLINNMTSATWQVDDFSVEEMAGKYVWRRQIVFSPSGSPQVLDGSVEYPVGSGLKPNTVKLIHDPTAEKEELEARNNIAKSLGYNNWAEFEAKVKTGKTIIENGYIQTSLINTEAIISKLLSTGMAGDRVVITGNDITVFKGSDDVPSMYIGGTKSYSSVSAFAMASTGQTFTIPSATKTMTMDFYQTDVESDSDDGGMSSGLLNVQSGIVISDTGKINCSPTFKLQFNNLSNVSITHFSATVFLYLVDSSSDQRYLISYGNTSSASTSVRTFSGYANNVRVIPSGTYNLMVELVVNEISYNCQLVSSTTKTLSFGIYSSTSASLTALEERTEVFANGMGYKLDKNNYNASVGQTNILEWGVQSGTDTSKYGLRVDGDNLMGVSGGTSYVKLMPIGYSAAFNCSSSGINKVVNSEFSQTGNTLSSYTRTSQGIYSLSFSKSISSCPIIVTPVGSSSSATVMCHVYSRSTYSMQIVFRTSTSGGSNAVDPSGFSILIIQP